MRKVITLLILTFCVIFGVYSYRQIKPKHSHITIAFAGDTMLGRLVNEKIEKTSYSYPFGDVLPLLHQTNLNVINLETTLTKHKKKVPKVFNFRAEPDRVKSLQKARIDIVCLANNHIKDFGDEGLQETIKTLDKAGIKHVGAGNNIKEAKKSVVIEKNGIKIGIIGYTDNEPDWKAQKNKPGTNYIKVGDIAAVKSDVAQIRHQVDILIATLQWGPNMRQRPSQKFVEFAHQMVDSGIDIVHGHSAHIFQGIEVYKKKLIIYDTGDFVDDYHVTPELRNDQSFLFLVTVEKSGPKKLELIPLLISNMQVNIAKEPDRTESLRRMQQLSKELGSHIDKKGTIKISE